MPNMTTRLDRLCLALTGQDALVVYHQLQAIFYNLVTWLLVVLGWRKASDSLVPVAAILPPAREPNNDAVAAVVLSPGGLERLSLEMLGDKVVTVGYNVLECNRVPSCNSLAIVEDGPLPDGLAIVRITSCSVNYADITIRWGLYESAIRYVGYPIVPGFDFAGIVERVGRNAGVEVGDDVFGITFFGAYSSRVLVPGSQCRARPQKALTPDEAAALPPRCRRSPARRCTR